MDRKYILLFIYFAFFTFAHAAPTTSEPKGYQNISATTDLDTLITEVTSESSENNRTPSNERRYKEGRNLKDIPEIMWDFSKLWATSTTTAAYDEWWYPSTLRAPSLNWKDYPGRPGVASWKEISPVSSDKKSGKGSNPTAAGVTSGSLCLNSFNPFIFVLLTIGRHYLFSKFE